MPTRPANASIAANQTAPSAKPTIVIGRRRGGNHGSPLHRRLDATKAPTVRPAARPRVQGGAQSQGAEMPQMSRPPCAARAAPRMRHRLSACKAVRAPLTEDDLAAVLGVLAQRADGHRSYPAAGALYAIGLVAWLFSIDHPLNGHAVQYDAAGHGLADLGEAPRWADEAIAFTGDPASDPPAAFLGLFANLDQLHAKYGDRGGRFALLEAGEVLQQLSLAVAARGLAGYAVGGSIDDRMIALAGLQPVGARFVVGYALGKAT